MATVAPQEPAWVPKAPIQINETASIAARPAEVWNVLADNSTWVDWFPGFTHCASITDAPHQAGSIREVKQDQFTVKEKITNWEPGRHWAMTVTEIRPGLLASMAETVSLTEAEPGLTSIEWNIGVATKWWIKPARSQLAKKATENLHTALQNLETYVQNAAEG